LSTLIESPRGREEDDEDPGATAPGDDAPSETTRRCIATGEVRPKAALVRFVVSPEGRVVPDIAERLPGRGLWLTARRDIVTKAVTKRLFARAARRPVLVEDALADRVEALLVARCRDLLGLARRAGEAQMGFVKVERLLASGEAGLLLAARDGAADGRGKLEARAGGMRERALLGTAELGAAFGRDAAVHAALRRGALASALARELDRLEGFRPEARLESRGQRRDGSRGLFRNDVAVSERE
jgi:hypothetical protein